ncbi:MAG: EAL domain-containing protein [Candidatus Desulfofervidaceae bacterium]|nr:EAL domain-containing protein [Candidatus Desulfofervidaceae bacterium]
MQLHRRYSTMTTFFILFTIFVAIASFVLIWTTWIEVKKSASLELEYINKMVSNSFVSDLHQNETLLNLLGERLLEADVLNHPTRAQKLLRQPLMSNPNLAAFGVARTDGQLIAMTYIPKNYTLPNLLSDEKSRSTFQMVLDKKRMVIGHTYNMPLLDKWVIPLRIPIFNKQHKVAFVLTTGIDLQNSEDSWMANGFPSYIDVVIVRDDNYFTYVSNIIDKKKMESWYYSPAVGTSLEQVGSIDLRGSASHSFDLYDRYNERLLLFTHYNKEYHSLYVTSISYNRLYENLNNQLNYFIFGIVLFYLFTFIFYVINHKRDLKQTEELVWSANHDTLTQLPNRYFLQQKSAHWNEVHRQYSALFMDLNNFKSINDNYGHPFGDKLLVIIAQRLSSVVQEHEYVIRQGGDEFIALTPRPYKQIAQFAQHIIHVLSEAVTIDSITLYPKVTIGIAHYPHDANSIDLLLSKADMALYKAKENKLGFLEYSYALEEASKARLDIEMQLRTAMDNDEFYVLLQPQMNAITLEIEGVEALVRWENKKLGSVPPDKFITVAEENGEISRIGRFVLRRACEMVVKTWKETDRRFTLSVNASADELLNDDYLDHILMVLHETGFPHEMLIIEVTESLLINDVRKAKQVLNDLRNEGIGVSLDDFGTGYSSLSMLKGLPVTELKIDQSFIKDFLIEKQDLALTKSIIALSELFDLKTVAEGVEEEGHVFELQNAGCTILQGFYFSKPLTQPKLAEFINEMG